jgi:predicted dinucleotide-binding enzyme
MMSYAIIGSGHIGSALAAQFARKRVDLQIATRSGPESLAGLVRELGSNVRAVPVAEGLRADIVILAVPFTEVRDAVRSADGWNGRIVVDATNAAHVPASELGGRLSTEIVSDAVPGARVVKGFNTMFAAVLAQDPAEGGGQRVVFLSGNDDDANAEIARLAELLGFAPVVLGRLTEGGRLQHFGAPLVGLNLVKHPNPGH